MSFVVLHCLISRLFDKDFAEVDYWVELWLMLIYGVLLDVIADFESELGTQKTNAVKANYIQSSRKKF